MKLLLILTLTLLACAQKTAPSQISAVEKDALRIKQIELVSTQRDFFQVKIQLEQREQAFRQLLQQTEQKYKGYKLDENTLELKKEK